MGSKILLSFSFIVLPCYCVKYKSKKSFLYCKSGLCGFVCSLHWTLEEQFFVQTAIVFICVGFMWTRNLSWLTFAKTSQSTRRRPRLRLHTIGAKPPKNPHFFSLGSRFDSERWNRAFLFHTLARAFAKGAVRIHPKVTDSLWAAHLHPAGITTQFIGWEMRQKNELSQRV